MWFFGCTEKINLEKKGEERWMDEGLNGAKWDEDWIGGTFKCAAPFEAQNLLRHHSHDCPAALALLPAPGTAMWLRCSQTCSQWVSQNGSDTVWGQDFV